MKNLNKLDLIELSKNELTATNGGIIGAIVAGVVGGLILSAIDNWADIKKGTIDAHSIMQR